MSRGAIYAMLGQIILSVVLFVLVYNILTTLDSITTKVQNPAVIPVLSLYITQLWANFVYTATQIMALEEND
jgi:phosphoribosylcarboxyaminoimidazole (NCAIR) mutase